MLKVGDKVRILKKGIASHSIEVGQEYEVVYSDDETVEISAPESPYFFLYSPNACFKYVEGVHWEKVE